IGYNLQYLVPGRMSVTIIDVFEVVDIHHNTGKRIVMLQSI
ncbi:unnamed protein product, partial [marine sediment metagenome]